MRATSLQSLVKELERINLKGRVVGSGGDTVVTDLYCDSRKVTRGSLFVAIRGRTNEALNFVDEAKNQGAVAILTDRAPVGSLSLPVLLVEDLPRCIGVISSIVLESRVSERIAIGVTGTNGKTSVSYILAQCLAQLLGESCYVGTLGMALVNRTDQPTFVESSLTTPTSIDFHRFMAAKQSAKAFAVEISSISLEQRRLEELNLDIAVFTNFTRDHLDYHKSFEEYFRTKELLFIRDLKASSKSFKRAVLNVFDPAVSKLAQRCDSITFSTSPNCKADISLTSFKLTPLGTWIDCTAMGERVSANVPLVGRYNLENLLAVIATLCGLNFSSSEISHVLTTLRGVPGRLEMVPGNIGGDALPGVYVDYAHTPDALEKAICSVREFSAGRVVTVFGCGGNRDKGKRPLMGEIASKLSDSVVVTSDNPRCEEPWEILRDIERGIINRHNAKMIKDRKEAIAFAIRGADPGDVVLIAGKGHETYQEIAGVKYPFSDREIAREILLSAPAKQSRRVD